MNSIIARVTLLSGMTQNYVTSSHILTVTSITLVFLQGLRSEYDTGMSSTKGPTSLRSALAYTTLST